MNNVDRSPNVLTAHGNESSQAGAVDLAGRLLDARHRLQAAADAAHTKEALLAALPAVFSDVCRPHGVLFASQQGEAVPQLDGLTFPAEGLNPELHRRLLALHEDAVRERSVRIAPLTGTDELISVAAPVLRPGQPTESLIVLVDEQSRSWEIAAGLAELAASYIRAWYVHRQLADAGAAAKSAEALSTLIASVGACDDLEVAGRTIVNRLQSLVGCRQVVLGLVRNGKLPCRVRAVSGDVVLDPGSDALRALAAVLDESILRGTLTIWPPRTPSDRQALLAHKKLAALTSTGMLVSSAIRDSQGRLQGALLFLADAEFADRSDALSFIRSVEVPLGSALHALKRAERGRAARLVERVRLSASRRRGRTALLVVLLVAAVLALPVPYKVKCACELQPVARRFVAAPFDGTLQKTHVEPGDIVAEDQLLAVLDGREIRWELAGVVADHSRAEKERDTHLAKHDFGAAQLSKLEMERLQLKVQLLEHRAENLQVRSPTGGIVISGDLKKAEGMPLTVGQSLFEIAPLDEMIVEAAVPAEDIAHVRDGFETTVSLDAFPGQTWHGKLARIHPRSELREHEHVFVGELNLANPHRVLRPGMRGQARIVGANRPIVWTLFHKPWDKLALWWGR